MMAGWQWIALYTIGACLTAFLHNLFRGNDKQEDMIGFSVLWPFFAVAGIVGGAIAAPCFAVYFAISWAGKLGSKGNAITEVAQ